LAERTVGGDFVERGAQPFLVDYLNGFFADVWIAKRDPTSNGDFLVLFAHCHASLSCGALPMH
jgi:hypothetical protein